MNGVSAGAGLQTGAGSWLPWGAAPRPSRPRVVFANAPRAAFAVAAPGSTAKMRLTVINPGALAWNKRAEAAVAMPKPLPGKALKMWRNRTPVGQRTEVTNPLLAILGAIAILFLAAMAFSLWPNTETVRSGPTANLPDNQKGASEAPGSPKGTN